MPGTRTTHPRFTPSEGSVAAMRPTEPVRAASVTELPQPRRRGTADGLPETLGDLHRELLPLDDDGRPLHHQKVQALHAGLMGSIHSWELVTAVDGPGTRMTLFLSGCPLQCQYCHNPDTMQLKNGTLQSVEEVLKRVKRYRKIFQATGGGLTISGGEPLFQHKFERRILRGAQEMGVHTAIDTSGFLGRVADDELLADVDLVLLDVKSGDEATYRETTGRALAPTLAFGDRLAEMGKPVWIRFVLVPGLTDAPENIQAVAEIVSRWDSVQRVEVLPFHNMGEDKWNTLGLNYSLKGVQPPSLESTEAARETFRAKGLTVY